MECGNLAVCTKQLDRRGTFPLAISAVQRDCMKLTLEIRPAEGGDDAKLLVHDQAAIYARFADRNGIKATLEHRGYL